MKKQIIIHNTENFINAFNQMNCGEKPFAELSANDFEIPFTTIQPTNNYEIPINEETKEQFPYCCNFHKSIFKNSTEWFEKFPNCCEAHRKLLKAHWFNKENYNDAPLKIVQQLSFVEQHIKKQIENSDWYKDITDYIHYSISSFGQLPTGYGGQVGLHIYCGNLKHWITNTPANIPNEKRKRLIEYLESYGKPSTTKNTDLNILYSTYQKWLKEFPFELNSYFGSLKQHYEKKLFFFNGKPEVNKYSGLAKGELHTKSSLFEALINLTDNLLKQVNGDTLLDKGVISDTDKLQIELIRQERRQKLKTGYKNSSPDEGHRYRKMIKDWLKDEQIFWAKMKPVLQKTLPPQQTETKPAFKNNFDNIATDQIYEHFKVGLVKKGYLTEQELNEYLKAAFELKTIPKTLFKIKDAPKKATIEAVFYTYYKNVAGKVHGKQNSYAALLGDYFEGYKTATISSNFSKTVY